MAREGQTPHGRMWKQHAGRPGRPGDQRQLWLGGLSLFFTFLFLLLAFVVWFLASSGKHRVAPLRELGRLRCNIVGVYSFPYVSALAAPWCGSSPRPWAGTPRGGPLAVEVVHWATADCARSCKAILPRLGARPLGCHTGGPYPPPSTRETSRTAASPRHTRYVS